MFRPTHFEIPADDIERAVKFFTEVFGWKCNDYGGGMQYYLTDTGSGEGINGAIAPRNQILNTICNSIEVPSVDEYVKKVEANGGSIIFAKQPIPTIGWIAYFKDTEGNTHCLFQPDTEAK
jgi:uncharacterized protein